MTTRAPRPPHVPGTLTPTTSDTIRSLWWSELGFLHGARHASSTVARTGSLFLAIAWWPCYPVLVVVQLLYSRRPWARYYLSVERDALLAISATRDGWRIEDHVTRRIGAGSGKLLRDLVRPALLQAADREGVAIHLTAADARLAERYVTELPGLVDVGAAFPRGRRLRRRPTVSNHPDGGGAG